MPFGLTSRTSPRTKRAARRPSHATSRKSVETRQLSKLFETLPTDTPGWQLCFHQSFTLCFSCFYEAIIKLLEIDLKCFRRLKDYGARWGELRDVKVHATSESLNEACLRRWWRRKGAENTMCSTEVTEYKEIDATESIKPNRRNQFAVPAASRTVRMHPIWIALYKAFMGPSDTQDELTNKTARFLLNRNLSQLRTAHMRPPVKLF